MFFAKSPNGSNERMNRILRFPLKYWSGLVDSTILILVALYIGNAIDFSLLFTTTTPTGGDMASHFPTASYLRDALLPKGRLIGWNPGNYCGFPMFQFYFPMPFLVMVGLSSVMPLEISFKLISVLGIFLLPLTSYLAVRLMGQKFPTPAMAAIFSMPFLFAEENSMWGGNIPSNLAGEFNYQIAFALSVLFLASVFRNIHSSRRVVLNGILLGLMGVTHGVGLLFAVTVMTFFLVWPMNRIGKRILYLGRVCAIGGGLMAFWFLPFIVGAKWSTKFNLLWHISGFREVFPVILWPYLVTAIIGSLAVSVWYVLESHWKGRRSFNVMAQLAYLWFGIAVAAVLYETAYELNVVDIRFLPYVEFLPMLVAAICLGALASRFRATTLLLVIVGLGTAAWVSKNSKSVSSWARWNYSGFEAKGEWKTFKAVNDYLKGDETFPRVVYEHSSAHNRFGTPRAFENLPYFSGRSTLEGLYMQSSITTPFVFYLQSEISSPGSCPLPQYDYTSLNFERAVEHFRMFNISHFITISERVKNQVRSNRNFDFAAAFGDVEIYKIRSNQEGYVEPLKLKPVVSSMDDWRYKSYQWFRTPSLQKPYMIFLNNVKRANGPLSELPIAEDRRALPVVAMSDDVPLVGSTLHKDRIEIKTTTPGWPLLVKVSYHPNWRCDGGLGPYLASPSFMIIFPTQENVTMYFARGWAEWAGAVLTILTILVCLIRCRFTDLLLNSDVQVLKFRLSDRWRTTCLISCWLLAIVVFAGFALYNRSHSPARLYQKAEKAYSAGNLEEASLYFERLLKLAPQSSYADNANYLYAIGLWKQKKYRAALASFNRLVSRYPESVFVPEALYHIGLCHEALGRLEEAELVWKQVEQRFPGEKWGDFAKERLKKTPQHGSEYHRAMRLFDQGDLRNATRLLAQVKESSPEVATRRNAAYFHAVCYYKMKKWEKCLEEFEHLIQEDKESPWVPEAYYHIGMCSKQLGNMQKAKSTFRRLLKNHKGTRWSQFAEERLMELKHP